MLRSEETRNPEQTGALGARLAKFLSPGDVVLVEGDLGAGKTTFVRGACRALGFGGPVTSPTFSIGQRYPGPIRVSHVDLYRVAELRDEDPELLADYLGPDTIAFVEWPAQAVEMVDHLFRVVATVRIEHAGGDRRVVRIERAGSRRHVASPG